MLCPNATTLSPRRDITTSEVILALAPPNRRESASYRIGAVTPELRKIDVSVFAKEFGVATERSCEAQDSFTA